MKSSCELLDEKLAALHQNSTEDHEAAVNAQKEQKRTIFKKLSVSIPEAVDTTIEALDSMTIQSPIKKSTKESKKKTKSGDIHFIEPAKYK